MELQLPSSFENTLSVLPTNNKVPLIGKIKIIIKDEEEPDNKSQKFYMYKVEEDVTSYPQKPWLKSQKIPGSFYLWKNEIRYWDGRYLMCQHKLQPQECRICYHKPIYIDEI